MPEEIIRKYGIEREQITLEYLLAVTDLYSHDVEKIKEIIQERIEKNKQELVK